MGYGWEGLRSRWRSMPTQTIIPTLSKSFWLCSTTFTGMRCSILVKNSRGFASASSDSAAMPTDTTAASKRSSGVSIHPNTGLAADPTAATSLSRMLVTTHRSRGFADTRSGWPRSIHSPTSAFLTMTLPSRGLRTRMRDQRSSAALNRASSRRFCAVTRLISRSLTCDGLPARPPADHARSP
jgi:hypothetical protein